MGTPKLSFLLIIALLCSTWIYFLHYSVEINRDTADTESVLQYYLPTARCNCKESSSSKSSSLRASSSSERFTDVSQILKALDPKEKWDWPVIDAVYTWVDGSKPKWLAEKEKYRVQFFAALENKTEAQIREEDKIAGLDQGPNQANRYKDHNELKYSFRSIVKHAPWIRNIYLLTADGEGPEWLDASHPRITVLSHADIFENQDHLPTFSSRPIEASLPNIPGISENFLYFNDDMFFGLPVEQSDWIPDPTTGSQNVFLDYWRFPDCSEGCTYDMQGDGQCNVECNTAACNWDFGDCGLNATALGRKEYEQELKRQRANYTRNDGFFKQANMYTDGFFNRELGKSEVANKRRGPIAHLPYLINKRLYRDIMERFREEYAKTLTHRFRHVEDFQLSFTYYHYYAFQQVYAPTKQMIWRAALTTTKNKEPFLYGSNFDTTNKYQLGRRHFVESTESYRTLQECSKTIIETQTLSSDRIAECDEAVDRLHSEYPLRLPIPYLSVIDFKKDKNAGMYYFLRIVDGRKVKKWKRRLEEPRKEPRKFVCLEDMLLNGSSPEIEAKYLETFTALFPDPSPFEK
mmetsp:Transcript_43100/g.104315  ORF Transcript_43100/g.104315 Transcript_43100/m.104315 type:complete len:577 (+) Transcript_43100:80-1810(+)